MTPDRTLTSSRRVTGPTRRIRETFHGEILSVGSRSGVRVVVGRWQRSPLGAFVDAMVEDASGRRTLVAPSQVVADYVAATYTFDEVVLATVELQERADGWVIDSGPLQMTVRLGGRTPLGRLMSTLPAWTARPAFGLITDTVARLTMRGVRTRGAAGPGRDEHYGVTDLHGVLALEGTWTGAPLGSLQDVDPSPRFGFSSTPRRPAVATVTTTVTR